MTSPPPGAPPGDGSTTPGDPRPAASVPSLALTGERTGPDVPDENYWFQRHVAAYRHVAGEVHGTVLDAGCGEGFGLRILLDAGARGVIGADVDPVTADHARRRYADDTVPEIDVIEADLDDLPLVDTTLDAAICLQVVEHLDEPEMALSELVRVVHPGGRVVVSTPNRLTFTPGGAPPRNPFHVREYTAAELADLLDRAGLADVVVLGLHQDPRLAADVAAHAGRDPVAMLADPTAWGPGLRAVVHAVRADDFVVASDSDLHPVAESLDLVAWGRVPA